MNLNCFLGVADLPSPPPGLSRPDLQQSCLQVDLSLQLWPHSLRNLERKVAWSLLMVGAFMVSSSGLTILTISVLSTPTTDKLINLTSTASCSHSLLRTVTFLVKEEDIRRASEPLQMLITVFPHPMTRTHLL